jgi:hypothetical protein
MQKLKGYLGEGPNAAVQILQTGGMDGTLAREIANTLREVTQNQAKASAAVVETKRSQKKGKP